MLLERYDIELQALNEIPIINGKLFVPFSVDLLTLLTCCFSIYLLLKGTLLTSH